MTAPALHTDASLPHAAPHSARQGATGCSVKITMRTVLPSPPPTPHMRTNAATPRTPPRAQARSSAAQPSTRQIVPLPPATQVLASPTAAAPFLSARLPQSVAQALPLPSRPGQQAMQFVPQAPWTAQCAAAALPINRQAHPQPQPRVAAFTPPAPPKSRRDEKHKLPAKMWLSPPKLPLDALLNQPQYLTIL
eukprot:NODE_23466_length_665_cov_2.330855.p1 GENE.NODE_23466_length_665_cov_2.330855~~NODE_23466_length_665_cov_2.330855.p1  ORF type:complete len:220 (-),score=47.65 NODE_23466_length_665_cov_2.330855:4-582(-)